MKKIFLLFSTLALMGSCDERFGFLNTINRDPLIFLNNDTGLVQLKDSLKTSVKTGKLDFSFTLSFSDPEKQLTSVRYNLIAGTGVLRGNQGAVISSDVPSGEGLSSLVFKPDSPGNYTLEFIATDAFGKSATATINLFVFVNLPPTAKMVETRLNGASPFEYEFDASASSDRDTKYGGGIQYYRFVYMVNNLEAVVILTTQPKIKYVLPGPGGQEVRLEVFDNDGAKSVVLTKRFEVP